MHDVLRTVFCGVLLALATLASPRAADRPILILISLDGWRWDYLERFAPPALSALATRGVRADGLIPTFPSKTFPNHYSIVTGLYPHRHGIVSNSMRDPALPGRFTLGNRDVQQDTRWWGGEPIWVGAERQGQVAATMFWPGSDVEIAGDRPAQWQMFDGKVANADRVDRVLGWLDRPEASRPTFLTLYFSDVDSAGHDDGPESAGVREAAARVDTAVARLVAGIASLGLTPRVNLVIVSDHGMAALSPQRVIVLDDYIDLTRVEVIDSSPILGITPRVGTVQELYDALHGKHPSLEVFKREDLPAQYRLAGHPRMAAVIGIADDGWHITTRQVLQHEGNRFPQGTHGYDPRHRSMQGLFIAAGPAFRMGATVPPFENVHVYEMMCRVLGLRPAPNDGDARVTAGFHR